MIGTVTFMRGLISPMVGFLGSMENIERLSVAIAFTTIEVDTWDGGRAITSGTAGELWVFLNGGLRDSALSRRSRAFRRYHPCGPCRLFRGYRPCLVYALSNRCNGQLNFRSKYNGGDGRKPVAVFDYELPRA